MGSCLVDLLKKTDYEADVTDNRYTVSRIEMGGPNTVGWRVALQLEEMTFHFDLAGGHLDRALAVAVSMSPAQVDHPLDAREALGRMLHRLWTVLPRAER
ncbi:MAG TPA: hypothetical protein VM618_08430 [Acidimicrobiia bacterium]|nr:hypothetical protein [Acidimicrobiia bacterium]